FFKQKTAYEIWSSDVCSSDLSRHFRSFDGSCRKFVPSKYDSGPEVLIPSFQPINGERSELSTIDGRRTAIGRSLPCRARIDSPKIGRASCRERVVRSVVCVLV